MYIFLVLVVYNFGEIAINALLHFSLRGEYWNFILSCQSRAQLSSVLWTLLFWFLVQLKWTKMYFIVNYGSSQFVSKVLSKLLLKNSICNLCWVFSEASWTTAASILDVEAFHTSNMADRAAIWAPAKTTDN